MQAAGNLVAVLVELAAGVQTGQHDFGGRHTLFDVHIGRDAAAVVADGDAAVPIERQRTAGGEPGLRFVDGVVDDLERHVVQAGAVIGVADIHARALADGFQALEHGDRRGVVSVRFLGGGNGQRNGLGHAGELPRKDLWIEPLYRLAKAEKTGLGAVQAGLNRNVPPPVTI